MACIPCSESEYNFFFFCSSRSSKKFFFSFFSFSFLFLFFLFFSFLFSSFFFLFFFLLFSSQFLLFLHCKPPLIPLLALSLSLFLSPLSLSLSLSFLKDHNGLGGIYYVNAMETIVSTIETEALASLNVVNLMLELSGLPVHGSVLRDLSAEKDEL